ncbi:hypothetical protein F4823DRAFT_349049 [Ustulina deusta]|nr:hypothetical protein F4823DRAFT_349049 [Ustulina deusta]
MRQTQPSAKHERDSYHHPAFMFLIHLTGLLAGLLTNYMNTNGSQLPAIKRFLLSSYLQFGLFFDATSLRTTCITGMFMFIGSYLSTHVSGLPSKPSLT